MSSSSSTPPLPPVAAAAPSATPPASSPAPPKFESWRQWLRDLSPFVKGAFVVLLIAVGVAWYVFSGRVTTDDAQVDSHITAVAPQVPRYAVKLFINDNTPVPEGDLI